MLSFIKNLFRDSRPPEVVSKSSSPELVSEELAPAPTAASPVTLSQPAARVPTSGDSADAMLQLPLKPIVDKMARPLQGLVLRPPTAADKIEVPLATVLAQLATGSVKVAFREVKRSAPAEIFAAQTEADETPVELPLGEVLARVGPAQFARRREQKAVTVPSDFTPVFRTHSEPATNPAAAKAPSRPVPAITVARAPGSVAPRLAPSVLTKEPGVQRAATTPGQAPSTPITLKPAPTIPSHGGPDRPLNGAGIKPTAIRQASDDREPIKVPLTVVARNWPDPVRSEIVAAHFAASLLIPFGDLEAALKRGRAIFIWKQIRSWLSPKGTSDLTEYDDLTLELPLSVLAPMFIGRVSNTRTSAPAPADELPDVFVARKKAPESSKPELAAVPSSRPTAPAPGPAVRGFENGASSLMPEGVLKQPVAPAMTPALAKAAPAPKQALAPKDLVERACALHGVSGALVTTHDGLIIATHLPAGLNGEALGAFLPQIFARLAQYTRELKFENPTQINMLLGKTPLLLIKSPLAFLGVLGKPSEVLPQNELGSLVDQLSSGTN